MPGLADRLERLATLSPAALRDEWAQLYGSAAPSISPDLLALGLAYRVQEQALRTRELPLARLLRKQPAPTIKPGTQLVRSWNGRTISVRAEERGFLFEDRSYRSLSAIAREVTGTNWSGPRFFGLAANG